MRMNNNDVPNYPMMVMIVILEWFICALIMKAML